MAFAFPTTRCQFEVPRSENLPASREVLSLALNASGALPTGDKALGLSAGTPTYNVTSHGDYSFGPPFNPELEAGFGTTSALVNDGVRRSYTASGRMANFQVGAASTCLAR